MKSEESLDAVLYVLSCLRYFDTVWIDEIGVEDLRETSAERLNVPSSLKVRSLIKLWSQDLAAVFVRVLLPTSLFTRTTERIRTLSVLVQQQTVDIEPSLLLAVAPSLAEPTMITFRSSSFGELQNHAAPLHSHHLNGILKAHRQND